MNEDIEIRDSGGSRLIMPLTWAAVAVFVLIVFGWSAYAWVDNNYVSKDAYTADQKKMMAILQIIADNTSETKAGTLNIKFALNKCGIKVEEMAKPEKINL